MCGIVGGVSEKDIAFRLIKCLEAMEYRGYDAAGMAVLDPDGHLFRNQTPGRVQELLELLAQKPLSGNTGIGKTSWERHIEKKQVAAKSPDADSVALVINGIIENKKEIREFLQAEGFQLTFDSDEELFECLISYFLGSGMDPIMSVRAAEKKVKGFYSACIMLRQQPGRLIALRRGSSLVLGIGDNENFTGSDHPALLNLSSQVIYLEDGDIADIAKDRIIVLDESNQPVSRTVYRFQGADTPARRGRHSHSMLKDIFDQSDAALSAMQGRLSEGGILIESFGRLTPDLFRKIHSVHIAAEGPSYHVALVGRHWIEEVSGIPCTVINAGAGGAMPAPGSHTLFITISQSGESINTLAAFQIANMLGYNATLTIGNMPDSTLVQESNYALITGEGPEVTKTPSKSLTAQLCTLLLFATALGRYHSLAPPHEADLIAKMENLPRKISQALGMNTDIMDLSKVLSDAKTLLFFGSDIQLPIAMEGAARLTKLAGISAEACDLSQLERYLPVITNPKIPVIMLAPAGQKINRVMQKMMEMADNLFVFADEALEIINSRSATIFSLPSTDRLLSPITSLIPLQLLAYHLSVLKGANVDKMTYAG